MENFEFNPNLPKILKKEIIPFNTTNPVDEIYLKELGDNLLNNSLKNIKLSKENKSPTNINPPILIGDTTIDRFNKEKKLNWEPLNIINDSRLVLQKMPNGKTGIVLGAGPNTKFWKEKGWKTLDIDPKFESDIIQDVNYLENKVAQGSQDYLYAECIKLDSDWTKGANPVKLLEQANKALKINGTLIIETANLEGSQTTTIPSRKSFAEMVATYGFDTVVEISDTNPKNLKYREQQAIYYARKVREGAHPEKINIDDKDQYDEETGLPLDLWKAKY